MAKTYNQSDLAERLACSRQNICRMVQRADWPYGPGPWDEATFLSAIGRYVNKRLTTGPGNDVQGRVANAARVQTLRLLAARTAKVEQENEKLRLELAQMRHEYLDRDEVKSWFYQHMEMVKGQLASLPGMVGLWGLSPEHQVRVRQALERFIIDVQIGLVDAASTRKLEIDRNERQQTEPQPVIGETQPAGA